MLAYEDKNFDKSLALFQKAFKLIKDDSSTDIFHAAAAALRIGKDDTAEKLIRSAISGTNPSRDYYKNFEGFNEYKSKPFFVKIEKDYDILVRQFYSKLKYPKEIEDEILDMIRKDQEVRKSSNRNDRGKIDSLNIDRLIKITNKYGWIKKAWLLLWHQRGTYRENNYVWNHFRPLINNEIKSGMIRKSFWAIFDDEHSIQNSQTQIYGMYQNQYPIQNVETVDDRRNEIGLPPLWYLNKVYDNELPYRYFTEIKDLESFMKEYSIKG